MSVAGVAALGVFLAAGLAFGAASFSDAAGDDNAAPDITSVQVSEAADGLITLVVGVRNYQALPDDSWFNLWFDLDSDQSTGDAGDETLVRYVADGQVELYDWDGLVMAPRPAPAGVTGRFDAGVLTVTIPKADLGGHSAFGVLAVGSRSQEIVPSEFIASDFAPDRGRSAYAGPTQASFADPTNDEDAAPDVTDVRVTDTKDGWISFAVSTPNYASLPEESVIVVLIDSDNRVGNRDADADAELQVGYGGGEAVLERWDPRAGEWVPDEAPTRVRARNSGNVVTIEVHGSELENAPRFGFSLTSAAVDLDAQVVLGIDFAPEVGEFFRYALANKPALSLAATRLSAAPSRPRVGKPFTVNLAVRRSDTRRGITSGTVSCKGSLEGKPLKGKGSVARGAGHCSFVIPKSAAAGARLRGTITVRVDGKSVTAGFAYVVR